MDMLVKALRMNFKIVLLSGDSVVFDVDVVAEVCMIVVLGAVIVRETLVSALYVENIRAVVVIDVLPGTVTGVGINVLSTEADANM